MNSKLQKLGTLANMAKARGMALKINGQDHIHWKTGSANTLVLTRGTKLPLHIVDRSSSLDYIEERIRSFKILEGK